jgi:predicted nucleotidyltransferase
VAALPRAIQPVSARFLAALRARFGARLTECIVFGSWARGDATEDSDLDVFVVVDELTDAERREIAEMAYDVDSVEHDLHGLSPLAYSTSQAAELRARGRRLFADIVRDGIAL